MLDVVGGELTPAGVGELGLARDRIDNHSMRPVLGGGGLRNVLLMVLLVLVLGPVVKDTLVAIRGDEVVLGGTVATKGLGRRGPGGGGRGWRVVVLAGLAEGVGGLTAGRRRLIGIRLAVGLGVESLECPVGWRLGGYGGQRRDVRRWSWLVLLLMLVLLQGSGHKGPRRGLLGEADGTVAAAMVCADGFLEDDALIIALAVTFRLDAVATDGPALVTFDAALATGFWRWMLVSPKSRRGEWNQWARMGRGNSLRQPVFVLLRTGCLFRFASSSPPPPPFKLPVSRSPSREDAEMG